MTVQEIMTELQKMGNEGTKKVLMKHGAKEPFYGVKVGDLKKIQKKIKKNHELSLDLYATGNSDAMYLAALIADEKQISKAQLQDWANQANWYMLSEYAVAWITAESPYAWELALEWIDSDKPRLASAGWSTLGSYVAITEDEELDLEALQSLLNRIENNIHDAPNRVRYTMNGFLISLGGAVASFTDEAKRIANSVGKVHVEMGGTACKVPFAPDYIKKMEIRGAIGKKRKKARC